ncbi:MAG: alpha/beta fold hydrolase [Xenophilus sp.]
MEETVIRRGFVDGPFGQVHYREAGAGSGRPALVLLHQTADSGAMYADAMRALAPRLHVIAPDTPGFGASAAPAAAPGLAGYVDALLAFADALGLARAHWLGHHSGAGFALELAARHPRRVDRLVLCGVPRVAPNECAARIEALSPPRACTGADAIDWAWRRIVQRMGGWATEAQMRTSFLDTLGALGWIRPAYEAVYACDASARAAQVQAPTLLLCGEADGFAASQQALLPRFARGQLHLLAGVGASALLQAPAAFSAAVATFLGGGATTFLRDPGDTTP